MSSLKLPKMTYAHLSTLKNITWDDVKLAYQTTARRVGDGSAHRIVVRYFDTDIATLWPNGDVLVTSGGYDTATTRDRINAVLRDNGKTLGIVKRKYELLWVPRNSSVMKPFHTLTLLHDGTILDSLEEVNR